MNDEILDLIKDLKQAKKAPGEGFASEADVSAYLKEREALSERSAAALESIAKELEKSKESSSQALSSCKAQIEALNKSLADTKEREFVPMDKTKLLAGIARSFRAICARDISAAIAEKYGIAMQRTTGPGNQDWVVTRAPVGSPLTGGSGDTGQYTVSTVYERELLRYATLKSSMMGKVRNLPMKQKTHSYPSMDRHNMVMTWHTGAGLTIYNENSPTYQDGGKPRFKPRIELVAETLAAYSPYFDLFVDQDMDVDAEIGQLIAEGFGEAYGQEFDRQCTIANSNPFQGAAAVSGTQVYTADPANILLEEFEEIKKRVGRSVDREGMVWISHPDTIARIRAKRGSFGDYYYGLPNGDKPATITGLPYIECEQFPTPASCSTGEVFAVLMNPKLIYHGSLMGLEVRKFDATSEAMLHGEEVIRYRRREAFKVVQSDLIVQVKAR